MIKWNEYAKHKDLRSVMDSADKRGLKNKYINLLHHKVLSDAIGDSLKGKHIIDLGCGIGRFTRFLKACGAEVTGVDFCKEMLALNTECTNCYSVPAYNLPFADKSFDAVLSVWTMQYFDRLTLAKTIKEIDRILIPGGDVYLIEQLSRYGYGDVHPRYLFDYTSAFKNNFTLRNSYSIMREKDLFVGLIRRGIVPETYFSLLVPYHLSKTKNIYLNVSEYVDYFMVFKKGVI